MGYMEWPYRKVKMFYVCTFYSVMGGLLQGGPESVEGPCVTLQGILKRIKV